jgi:hypothetical protein
MRRVANASVGPSGRRCRYQAVARLLISLLGYRRVFVNANSIHRIPVPELKIAADIPPPLGGKHRLRDLAYPERVCELVGPRTPPRSGLRVLLLLWPAGEPGDCGRRL